MAQLKDDCFAFGDQLMLLDDALRLLNGRLDVVVSRKNLKLEQALGRILAEDVFANRAVPPADNSAVDGYAVCFDDLNPVGETSLPVKERVAAGYRLKRAAHRREAIRIFTGAPIPEGMDTVFMEEDCEMRLDEVVLPFGLQLGDNRRKKGEDITEGAKILTSGQKLRPQELALAASVGVQDLCVRSKLRVAVFSTGDEVCDLGDKINECHIFDANRYSIMALLKNMQCEVTDLGICSDNEGAIADAIGRAALDHDIIITSGGVSAGEEDHVKAAVEQQGRLYLWRLAIKPGRPIALGQIGHATFIGLPGNPVAAMVTFMVIARPVILKLAGAIEILARRYNVVADFEYKKKIGRREWVRGILSDGSKNELIVQKFSSSGAGILTSMVEADGLIELAEDIDCVSPGDIVRFLPFNEVSG